MPLETLVKKFSHVRFEPEGMPKNPHIPFAKSVIDYVARELGIEFIPGYKKKMSPTARFDDSFEDQNSSSTVIEKNPLSTQP